GRWPWSRSRVAELLDAIQRARPRVIGLNIVYSEPEQNQGLVELRGLQRQYRDFVAGHRLSDRGGQFGLLFSSAAVRLDSEAKLLASVRGAGDVLLPLFFAPGALQGAKAEELPPSIASASVHVQLERGQSEPSLPDGQRALYPIPPLAEA